MADAERRVAIVTGAARGLGRAIAEGLRADGYEIVACDLEASVEELSGLTFRADVSAPPDVRRVVDGAMAAFFLNKIQEVLETFPEDVV